MTLREMVLMLPPTGSLKDDLNIIRLFITDNNLEEEGISLVNSLIASRLSKVETQLKQYKAALNNVSILPVNSCKDAVDLCGIMRYCAYTDVLLETRGELKADLLAAHKKFNIKFTSYLDNLDRPLAEWVKREFVDQLIREDIH